MLISLNWLKKYVDIDGVNLNELENALTMIGQEVEKIEVIGEHLENVVVAQIIERTNHPDSEKLTICKVDNGKEYLQIICGASNHRAGDKVMLAQIGTKLAEDFVIKKSKIRGEESCGMLCSEAELGVGQDESGIIVLPEDTPIGISAREYFGINDTVFELEITPNRPDCLSHIGIARELSAYYKKPLIHPIGEVKESNESISDRVKIKIESKDISRRYSGRMIKNIEVKESPEWLKNVLTSMGVKSINNIVDVSNYVMFELNHPNHMFDIDKVSGNEIKVKTGYKEIFLTLDGKERELIEEDIIIADKDKVLGIAGVMGGDSSKIDESTKNIFIEVAHFNPVKIRKTSKRLGLSSDASYRFERGVDVVDAETVLNRIAKLVVEVAGGEVLAGIVDNYIDPYVPVILEFDLQRFYKFTGKEIPKKEIIDILERLEIIVKDNDKTLELVPPSFRDDLSREQDFYEEVIRMYGFDNIENTNPSAELKVGNLIDNTKMIDMIKDISAGAGLAEVINYSFIPRDGLDKIECDEIDKESLIEIMNPITEDFVIMRPTLMYSLIKNIKDNTNRGMANLNLFEIGKAYTINQDGQREEEAKLGIVLSGSSERDLYVSKPVLKDFYNLKGIVETIFEKMNFKNYTLSRSTRKTFHPGRSADVYVGKELIGTFGELHPNVLENSDAEKLNILIAEFSIVKLSKYIFKNPKYTAISKYQSVPRDLALVVNEDVLVGDMIRTISKVSNLVEKVDLFDVYTGENIQEGTKSVAVSIVIRDKNKTLDEVEITNVVQKILEKVKKVYGAELRE